MVQFQDYYKTLGINRDAKTEDIQKAFRKLARKYHPDVNKDKTAEETFKRINEAQEVLSDPEKRQLYDQLGQNWKAGQDFKPPPNYQDFFNQQNRSAKGFDFTSAGGAFNFDKSGGFSDFFQSLFGNRGASGFQGEYARSQQQAPANNSEADLEISIEESILGLQKNVSLRSVEIDKNGHQQVKAKTLSVKIPAGVRTGAVIRLAGQGYGGGDLLLKVRLANTNRLWIDNNQLYLKVKITPAEAALGAKIPVKLFNQEIIISTPACCSSGQRLRLKGQGLKSIKGNGREDLIVELEIKLPKELSDKEKSLYGELLKISSVTER